MRILALAATFCALASTSHAAVAVTNIAQPNNGGGWAVYNDQWTGMSFTVGNTAPLWQLESFELLMTNTSSAVQPITLALYADASGLPGALRLGIPVTVPMTTLGNPTTPVVVTGVPSAPVTLNAAATYWLVAESTYPIGVNGVSWMYSTPLSFAGQPGWSIGEGLGTSTTQGASWTFYNVIPSLFTVNASPVPEPGSAALALALGGVLLARRRRSA